ncbi:SDR family oxidoreductase [Nocardioides sp.]|uniref:SDR family oxidoreductase n=1 Tax=Nocardioides sp. TaxID=35761 RepID=UPI002732C537|nr:SDR family oxidoreductase [Nocardioides sp.]MDP3889945.1 SDR family oxidoreductase [Nocardioides sp.]
MRRVHPDARPAVVAGASSGIGAATALLLAELGHPVALGARRAARCQDVVDAIRVADGRAVAHQLDITSDESVADFATLVHNELGEVEVLVICAGRSLPGLAHEQPTGQVEALFDSNLLGAHRLVRRFVPAMVERRRGDVVFISSDSVQTLRPRTAAYNASKAALETLAFTMARELEGTGVRSSVVRPGPTMTEMGAEWPEDQTAAVIEDWMRWGLARHGAFLKAEAIAQAVATIVGAPPGTHFTSIDVQPEAPLAEPEETP